MQFLILVFIVTLCGCNGVSHNSSPSNQDSRREVLLDRVLTKQVYASMIAEAERDLPNDEWQDSPWRHNDSRERREIAVATKILDDSKTELKSMTVTDLVKSLKVFPYLGSLTNNFSGVAYYVYRNGNQMIIDEIKKRPENELDVLPNLADDKVEVFEGTQGPGDTLAAVINFRILNQPK